MFGLKQEPSRERVQGYINSMLKKLKSSPFNNPKYRPLFKENQRAKTP